MSERINKVGLYFCAKISCCSCCFYVLILNGDTHIYGLLCVAAGQENPCFCLRHSANQFYVTDWLMPNNFRHRKPVLRKRALSFHDSAAGKVQFLMNCPFMVGVVFVEEFHSSDSLPYISVITPQLTKHQTVPISCWIGRPWCIGQNGLLHPSRMSLCWFRKEPSRIEHAARNRKHSEAGRVSTAKLGSTYGTDTTHVLPERRRPYVTRASIYGRPTHGTNTHETCVGGSTQMSGVFSLQKPEIFTLVCLLKSESIKCWLV